MSLVREFNLSTGHVETLFESETVAEAEIVAHLLARTSSDSDHVVFIETEEPQ